MTWMNVSFPPRLAFGIECDPEWSTTVIMTFGGQESRNLNWANARHNYDASFAIRTADDHAEIRNHFHMARGKTHSWPLLDPLDHGITVAEGVAQLANDSDASFQLFKRYGSGAFAYDRKITRISVAQVYFSGVLQTPVTDYDLDPDTGLLIPIGTDISPDDVTWSGQFYVPCRYDTQKLPVRITNKTAGTEFLVVSEGIPIVEVKE